MINAQVVQQLVEHMSSESEEDSKELTEHTIFVKLLRDASVLFDKETTPLAKTKKKIALEALTVDFNLQTKQQLNTKQMLKKFNNTKTRLKATTDRNRIGARRVTLKKWEKEFMEIWNAEENKGVLSRIPSTITIGSNCQLSSEVKEDTFSDIFEAAIQYDTSDDFERFKIEDLHRMALIAKIEARRRQERVAVAQERAAIAQEKAAIAQEKAAIAQEKAAVAQESLALKQKIRINYEPKPETTSTVVNNEWTKYL